MKFSNLLLSTVLFAIAFGVGIQAYGNVQQPAVQQLLEQTCNGITVTGDCVVTRKSADTFPAGSFEVSSTLSFGSETANYNLTSELQQLLASDLLKEALVRVRHAAQQMSLAAVSEIYISLRSSAARTTKYASWQNYHHSMKGMVEIFAAYNTSVMQIQANQALERCLTDSTQCVGGGSPGRLPKVRFIINDSVIRNHLVTSLQPDSAKKTTD